MIETLKFKCACKTEDGVQLVALRGSYAMILETNNTYSVCEILEKDLDEGVWTLKLIVNFPRSYWKHTVGICNGVSMRELIYGEYS